GIAALAASIGDEFSERRCVSDAEVEALRTDGRQHVASFTNERHAVGSETLRSLGRERKDPARAVNFHLAEDRVGAALDLAAELPDIEGVQPFGLIGHDDAN